MKIETTFSKLNFFFNYLNNFFQLLKKIIQLKFMGVLKLYVAVQANFFYHVRCEAKSVKSYEEIIDSLQQKNIYI